MGRGDGVRAASKSSVIISFQYRGARCREKLKLAPTDANKRYVRNLKSRIMHEIATNTFDYAKHFPTSKNARKFARTPGTVVTVAEQLIRWLDSREGEIEMETFHEYELDIKRHLVPTFGEHRLSELTKQTVKGWAGKSGLSLKRINNVLIPLRSMYEDALNQDPPLIDRNPLAGLALKRVRTVKTEDQIDPFTRAEMKLINEKCNADEDRDFIEFWNWTGLRLQEIIVLMWGDIDWVRGTFRISRAMREGRIKAPKTEAGEREVKLLAPALAALKRQKARTFLADGFIWRNPRTGEPWAGDGAVRKTFWQPLCRRAGVRYRPPKQMRHTYASWMLSAYENPLWVARQMGHTDWSEIISTYGKWIPDVDPHAGDRAVEAIVHGRGKLYGDDANGTIRALGGENAK
jgi:integrase